MAVRTWALDGDQLLPGSWAIYSTPCLQHHSDRDSYQMVKKASGSKSLISSGAEEQALLMEDGVCRKETGPGVPLHHLDRKINLIYSIQSMLKLCQDSCKVWGLPCSPSAASFCNEAAFPLQDPALLSCTIAERTLWGSGSGSGIRIPGALCFAYIQEERPGPIRGCSAPHPLRDV